MLHLYIKRGKRQQGKLRPVSIIRASKILERILFEQMSGYFDKFYQTNSTDFEKDIIRNILLNLLEKWKNSVDKGKSFGALLTYLSKAFDCLDHELLTAKLNAYGFTLPALQLNHDYLSNRKQRTKIDDNYSSWSEILFDVPQESILVPLLFNIFLVDLFFVVKDIDIANYADDSTTFIVENNIDNVIESLEQVSDALFN